MTESYVPDQQNAIGHFMLLVCINVSEGIKNAYSLFRLNQKNIGEGIVSTHFFITSGQKKKFLKLNKTTLTENVEKFGSLERRNSSWQLFAGKNFSSPVPIWSQKGIRSKMSKTSKHAISVTREKATKEERLERNILRYWKSLVWL